jgi:hypothetical protein
MNSWMNCQLGGKSMKVQIILNLLFTQYYWINLILDNDGPYYWHIKSGTIQREPPEYSGKNEPKTPLVKDAESVKIIINYFFV